MPVKSFKKSIDTGALALLVALCQSSPALSVEQDSTDKPAASKWDGEAELGLNLSRGNTNTDNLNAKFRVENIRTKWRNKAEIKVFQASDQGQATAENYQVLGRSEYLLNENNYLFGSLRYEDDRFAGYDQRTTEVVGYGHQFLKRADMHLKGEFGVGARQTDYTDGTKESGGIIRLGMDYEWKFTETSRFNEELFVEAGKDNTYTESVTSLTVKINAALAMKLGVTVQNNSSPPPGFKNTDTITAVTLVYDF